MPSVAFLAPVLCFVAGKLSAARCHISAHGHATVAVSAFPMLLVLFRAEPGGTGHRG